MKEFRLIAWPELSAEYKRTAHRRALTELSARFVGLARLAEVSGLKKGELRAMIERLEGQGLIAEQDTSAPDSFFDSLRPLGWLRRSKKAELPQRR